MRIAAALTAAVLTLIFNGAITSAVPRASLHARFAPDVAGHSTTIHFGFRLAEPAPLKSIELELPAGMGIADSALGLEECQPALLEEHGPSGCPANSLLGFGTVFAEAPLPGANFNIQEPGHLTLWLGPPSGKTMTVLFWLEATHPVWEQTMLPALLRPVRRPYSDALTIQIPAIPVWTGGPDVAITRLEATIGPYGLLYQYREHGLTFVFTPRGVTVPPDCPPHGYPLQAHFTWWHSTPTVVARTRVACPRTREKRAPGRKRRDGP
jgi:hypothetical protein